MRREGLFWIALEEFGRGLYLVLDCIVLRVRGA